MFRADHQIDDSALREVSFHSNLDVADLRFAGSVLFDDNAAGQLPPDQGRNQRDPARFGRTAAVDAGGGHLAPVDGGEIADVAVGGERRVAGTASAEAGLRGVARVAAVVTGVAGMDAGGVKVGDSKLTV